MQLTAEMVDTFSGLYLSSRYDQPQPTPEFHRECWARYCSDVHSAATAAPRNHAKSSALTHAYVLASVLSGAERYVIILGSSEELAIEHLGDIANELRENDELIKDFRIKGFLVDQKTDIVIECTDGHQFRIIARGAEQKIRGRKWHGQRPGLIVADDLEDDEQVSNRDRRIKFRRWFFRAAKQALRDGGRIRVHGTILHIDSLLAHLMKNQSWASRCYRAHRSFSDFSEILWPEKFPEAKLRQIRDELVRAGDSAGYAQEYLNDPRDDQEAYLRRDDFLEMKEPDYDSFKRYAVGCDFAISKKDSANRTSFTVAGRDCENVLHVVDQRVGRWDTNEIIEEMFLIRKRWDPEVFYVEKGQIWSAIRPTINSTMMKRDAWIYPVELASISDKASRGRSFQRRMRAGACRFDKKASWYPEYEDELLSFSPHSEAVLDDQFDSTTILSRGLEDAPDVGPGDDELTDEDRAQEEPEERLRQGIGRNKLTGY
jgi:hypothetical protein